LSEDELEAVKLEERDNAAVPSDAAHSEGNGSRPHIPAPDDATCPLDPASVPSIQEVIEAVRQSEAATLPPAPPGYQMLEVLGRGGMGVVYKALQVRLNRVVAIKTLQGACASRAELARFWTEAEAVARLRHPNVVQIYEVAEHEGRPFLALEYVEGGSLERRLSGAPQPPRHAAEMVRVLSLAVHAAHQCGIVHRDLKPSNVLVAGGQDEPLDRCTLKITDFGLAKRLDVDSQQTQTGDVMGTPSYMAPEQAGGEISRIGPRSDVYALGAMLYELITGRPPFRAATRWETVLQVRSEEPVAPRRLQPRTPRDLETICLKCLEKEPQRRYASAAGLAEDLQRFCAGETIHARPAGAIEKGLKWARRRPAAAVTVGLLGLMFIGLAVATVSLGAANRRESEARKSAVNAGRLAERRAKELAEALSVSQIKTKEAAAQRLEAQRKAAAASAVAGFMIELFRGSDPLSVEGVGVISPVTEDVTARELLDRGRAHLKTHLTEDPLIRAALLDAVGDVYRSLGRLEEAAPLLQEALEIRRQRLGPAHDDTVASLYHVAASRHDMGELAEAESLYREALALRTQPRGEEDLLTAAIMLNLAWILAHRFEQPSAAQFDEAALLLERVIEIRVRHLGKDHRDVRVARAGLALVLIGKREIPRATVVLGDALGPDQSGAGEDDAVNLAFLYAKYLLLKNGGRLDQAQQLGQRLLEESSRILGEDHPLCMLMLGELADLLRDQGKLSEAVAAARKALEYSRRSAFRWHPAGADIRLDLGDYERSQGNFDEAEKLYREALQVAEKNNDQRRLNRARAQLESLEQQKAARLSPLPPEPT
jgi:tetratricopeptide (TPR) repeat protein